MLADFEWLPLEKELLQENFSMCRAPIRFFSFAAFGQLCFNRKDWGQSKNCRSVFMYT